LPNLEAPPNAASLYDARRPDVEPLRPVMQGDVFENIEIPGTDLGLALAAVLTHPCTMRTTGGALRPTLLMARIVNYSHVPLEQWPTKHFRVQPLPDLRPDHAGENLAINFELIGTVASGAIDPGGRVAYLSDYGVTVMQQRFVHQLSRVVVDLPILHAQAAPNFEEASLLHEWLEAFVQDDPPVANDVNHQTGEFNGFLDANQAELRNLLHDPITRAEVRRRVRAEIKARKV
jgi:hypothetical protein